VALFVLPLVIGSSIGLAERSKHVGGELIAALLVVVVICGLIATGTLWMFRWANRMRLSRARRLRPHAVWSGAVVTGGLQMILGLVAFDEQGFQYWPSAAKPDNARSFALNWVAVERVTLRPRFDFGGKLRVQVSHGPTWTCTVFNDCSGAFEALVQVRDSAR
jgi:hypothetical protein